jgi:hypothetical protein
VLPFFRKSRDDISIKGGGFSIKGGEAVTVCVTKTLIKLLKKKLSLNAREDQAVKVANQNLNYQDFKFEVSKCYLVWTDILSQQFLSIY